MLETWKLWKNGGISWHVFGGVMRIEWENLDECQLLKLVPSYHSNPPNGDSLCFYYYYYDYCYYC